LNAKTAPDQRLPSNVFMSVAASATVLGGVGFACGFFGPMVFSPDANQGPMLGLFITGPVGTLLGVALGIILRALDLREAIASGALFAAAATIAIVTLYFSMPAPRYYADVVEGEVVDCAPPGSLREQTFEYWEQRIAKVTWAAPRARWKEDFDRMAAADPGVVLEVHVRRGRKLYENRKPWDRASFAAQPWTGSDAPTRYFARFAGGSCTGYPIGQHATYLARGESDKLWPPEVLSNFLGLQVIEPLPARFRDLVAM